MSTVESLIKEEFVCMHGHSLTSAGQLKLRKLYEQATVADALSKAEQLLLDIITHHLSGELLHNRARAVSPRMAALLDALETNGDKDEMTLGMDEIRAMVSRGEMFAAIRQYRELHGCGLLEAKRTCEQLQNRLT